jgi:hypothetical protein
MTKIIQFKNWNTAFYHLNGLNIFHTEVGYKAHPKLKAFTIPFVCIYNGNHSVLSYLAVLYILKTTNSSTSIRAGDARLGGGGGEVCRKTDYFTMTVTNASNSSYRN